MTENKRFEWILMEFWDNVSDEPLSFKEIEKRINTLNDENERLKERNKRQYNQLTELWSLIENKDWETLTEMDNQMVDDEKKLQEEWKCYE